MRAAVALTLGIAWPRGRRSRLLQAPGLPFARIGGRCRFRLPPLDRPDVLGQGGPGRSPPRVCRREEGRRWLGTRLLGPRPAQASGNVVVVRGPTVRWRLRHGDGVGHRRHGRRAVRPLAGHPHLLIGPRPIAPLGGGSRPGRD
ncbi:MAG TPA: hypothetical protein VGP53_09490, partial [Acidimicrobiales bacterium]|nr:hypothetical protein [Acidimicrobiales bacterium]